jgi:fatty acid desaturase
MEQQRKKSTGLYWLLFLAASALLIFGIWDHWEYLTLILPFQVTFFAKALDIM